MRTIKFKGKKVDNGEWVEGNLIQSRDGKVHILRSNSNPIHKETSGHWYLNSPCYEVTIETVGQFTGLSDKNGKEIFEGDILKISWSTPSRGGYFQTDDMWCEHEEVCNVHYVGSRFVFVKKDGKQTSTSKNAEIEIIGNIHDKQTKL